MLYVSKKTWQVFVTYSLWYTNDQWIYGIISFSYFYFYWEFVFILLEKCRAIWIWTITINSPIFSCGNFSFWQDDISWNYTKFGEIFGRLQSSPSHQCWGSTFSTYESGSNLRKKTLVRIQPFKNIDPDRS